MKNARIATTTPLRAVSSSVRKVLIFGLLLLSAATAWAETAGVVTHLSGTLSVRQADGAIKLLSVRSEVNAGDVLSTQEGTYARLKFGDGSEVVMRPNTQFAITGFRYKADEPAGDSFVVGLIKGGLRMATGLLGKRNPEKVGVTTPTATIGIRGTHFGLLMCQGDCVDIPTVSGQPPADGLHVDVAEGAIQVANPAGMQVLGAGQFGYVRSVVTPPVVVPPNQGIQVTMPASISQNNAAGRSVGESRQTPECAVQ